jgi:hypothetical protein
MSWHLTSYHLAATSGPRRKSVTQRHWPFGPTAVVQRYVVDVLVLPLPGSSSSSSYPFRASSDMSSTSRRRAPPHFLPPHSPKKKSQNAKKSPRTHDAAMRPPRTPTRSQQSFQASLMNTFGSTPYFKIAHSTTTASVAASAPPPRTRPRRAGAHLVTNTIRAWIGSSLARASCCFWVLPRPHARRPAIAERGRNTRRRSSVSP